MELVGVWNNSFHAFYFLSTPVLTTHFDTKRFNVTTASKIKPLHGAVNRSSEVKNYRVSTPFSSEKLKVSLLVS